MLTENSAINNIINDNRNIESIFERFGIDRNNRAKNLHEICSELNIDLNFLLEIISISNSNGKMEYRNLSLFSIEILLDYLRRSHFYYLNTKLPEIEQSIFFLKKDFTRSHPILILLSEMFIKYKVKLSGHIRNEEELLFPYIDHLLKRKNTASNYGTEYYRKYSVAKFISSHNDPEQEIKEIKEVIRHHSCLSEEVMPFQIFLNQIESFEKDLSFHTYIEDVILVPKVLKLEAEIKQISN